MLNIDVKFSGNTKERIEALINGFDKKRGVLMGKIAKRMEVDLRNKFLSNALMNWSVKTRPHWEPVWTN